MIAAAGTVAAAASPPAGGAPLAQVVAATAVGMALTAVLVVVGLRYRDGRTAELDLLAAPFRWLLRVPGWAALPAALATGSLLLAGAGFYWDVAVHIDRGRDPGPFGTPAHYPILIGLFGLFSAGWLALVMSRGDDASPVGVRLSRGWTVPASGVAMMASAAFALVGFPLDDIWHTIFGQDVTLWGPTHLIMLTGGQLVIVTILGLIAEGRAAARRARAAAGSGRVARRAARPGRWLVAVAGSGGILAGLTVYQAEFAFGVPQFHLLFQPALLAFTGTLALVLGRLLAGRGGALAAALFNVALSAAFAVLVGPILGHATPNFSTYLPAALLVELAALVVSTRRLRLFTVIAGLLVGTLGTLADWGWTHVWMPIPWPAHFVGSAVAIAVPAAVCGAIVGTFVAGCLAPYRVPRPVLRPWLPAALAMVGFAAVLGFCLPLDAPAAATATVVLDRAPTGPHPSSNATVTVHPAALAQRADFFQQISWQGHAKRIEASLRRIGPGVYRTTRPLPLYGTWKSLLRIQTGRIAGDVPVFLPADRAIPVGPIPALRSTTRTFVSDVQLMQRERKHGIPGWLWSAATSAVLAIIAVLLAILGWGLNRVGGEGHGAPPQRREQRRRTRPPARVATAGARR